MAKCKICGKRGCEGVECSKCFSELLHGYEENELEAAEKESVYRKNYREHTMKRIIFAVILMLAAVGFGADRGRYSNTINAFDSIEQKANTVIITPKDDLATKYAWLVSSGRDGSMGALSASAPRTLWLASGVYYLSASLAMESYTNIMGMPGAVIKLANSSNANMVTATSKTNLGISGITFDGNRENQTNTDTTKCNIIKLATCSNITIDNVNTSYCRGDGIQLSGCTDFTISNGTDYSSGIDAILILTCLRGNISNYRTTETYYSLRIQDSSGIKVSDYDAYLAHNEALVINKVSTGCSRIQVVNSNFHDAQRLWATGLTYTNSTKTISGVAAGDIAKVKAGDSLYVTTGGAVTSGEYIVASVGTSTIVFAAVTSSGDDTVSINHEVYGLHLAYSTDVKFTNCTFYNFCGVMGIRIDGARTSTISDTKDIAFTNCSFLSALSDRSVASGMSITDVDRLRFVNCTVKGNQGNGCAFYTCKNVAFIGGSYSSNLLVGMYFTGCDYVTMNGIAVLNNGTHGSSGAGIIMTGTVSAESCKIIGCVIGNETTHGTNYPTEYGVEATGSGMGDASVRVTQCTFINLGTANIYDSSTGTDAIVVTP